MWQLKPSNCDKIQKFKFWQKPKIKIVTTQKPRMWQNSQTQTVTKIKNSNCDQSQKLKLWQNSKTQRATGPVLTSVKEKKHVIPPTTLNFALRRGKLRIYTLQNTPGGILKVCPFWRLQGMCCGMFCLDGEVVFIHSEPVN